MHRPRSISKTARLGLERLEDRCVLDAGPGGGQLLVRFQAESSPFAVSGAELSPVAETSPGLYTVRLDDQTNVDAALAAYRADSRVEHAEIDGNLSAAWLPNDPNIPIQWNMSNTGQTIAKQVGTPGADINASTAWGITTGSKRNVVAVLDSGIDFTHPDLYLNIWLNQGEIPASRRANLLDIDGDGAITFHDLNDTRNQGVGKITDLNGNKRIDGGDLLYTMSRNSSGGDTGNGGWADGLSQDGDSYIDDLVGWNFSDNNNNPKDSLGHGTTVAGVVGARGNNRTGVAGVAWNVQLMPVRFFNASGGGSTSAYIAGLKYALAKGVKVSVNSFVDSGYSQAMFNAIKEARDKGHLYVAAAGNAAKNNDSSPTYPASYNLDNIISVAASNNKDMLPTFSNYGATAVDLAAPGVDIPTTTAGGGYGTRSGTSFAAPHVAGVASLVWGLRPEWTYQQVIAQILNSAKRLPSMTGKVLTGRLDAGLAVQVPPRGGLQPSALSGGGGQTSGVGSGGSLGAAEFVQADAEHFAQPEVATADVVLPYWASEHVPPLSSVGVITEGGLVDVSRSAEPDVGGRRRRQQEFDAVC